MKRYVRYEPFDVYLFDATEWQHPVHKHTYFEIIFIREGKGVHVLNGNSLPYAAGDVFLLGPEDYHYFEIEQPSRFAFIRFTEDFVHRQTAGGQQEWQQIIQALFSFAYQANGSIVQSEEEKTVLGQLLAALIYEYGRRSEPSYGLIIDGIMKAMLGILARNIIGQPAAEQSRPKGPRLIEELLVYIRQHISNPEALRMERLTEVFPFSASYLSTYFKKQVGESLQQYILKYKLKLIEDRLLHSSRSIAEISQEFGFTDLSHLNKIFRKHYGLSPTAFRKKGETSR